MTVHSHADIHNHCHSDCTALSLIDFFQWNGSIEKVCTWKCNESESMIEKEVKELVTTDFFLEERDGCATKTSDCGLVVVVDGNDS